MKISLMEIVLPSLSDVAYAHSFLSDFILR